MKVFLQQSSQEHSQIGSKVIIYSKIPYKIKKKMTKYSA